MARADRTLRFVQRTKAVLRNTNSATVLLASVVTVTSLASVYPADNLYKSSFSLFVLVLLHNVTVLSVCKIRLTLLVVREAFEALNAKLLRVWKVREMVCFVGGGGKDVPWKFNMINSERDDVCGAVDVFNSSFGYKILIFFSIVVTFTVNTTNTLINLVWKHETVFSSNFLAVTITVTLLYLVSVSKRLKHFLIQSSQAQI